MRLKIGLNLTKNYSINFNEAKRSKKSIKFIIIHFTGMKNESEAIQRLCDSNSKVSSHYFIKNNGSLLQLVPDLYEAWHAGKSSWKNFNSLNKYSIGIEINNPGHVHGYKNFKNSQIKTLKKILKYLITKYRINSENVLGHSDIAPNRKKDPGEKFPWRELSKNKLCIWHKLNEKELMNLRNQKITLKEKDRFIKNLHKIGYSRKRNDRNFIIKAFQRRFRQNLVNGKIDEECFLISKNIIKS